MIFVLKLHSWDQPLRHFILQRTKFIMQDMGHIIYNNSRTYNPSQRIVESTHPGATDEIEALTSVRRNTLSVKSSSAKSDEIFVKWRKILPTNIFFRRKFQNCIILQ